MLKNTCCVMINKRVTYDVEIKNNFKTPTF